MMGSVFFKRKKFNDLLEKFAGFENGAMNRAKGYVNRSEFNNSPAMPTAHYMSGLALLASGKFERQNLCWVRLLALMSKVCPLVGILLTRKLNLINE